MSSEDKNWIQHKKNPHIRCNKLNSHYRCSTCSKDLGTNAGGASSHSTSAHKMKLDGTVMLKKIEPVKKVEPSPALSSLNTKFISGPTIVNSSVSEQKKESNVIYQQRKNPYYEEIQCFDKTIEIDPNNAKAWHNKGFALSKLGQHQEAIKFYDGAIEIDPNLGTAWYNKGLSLDKLGYTREAIQCFDKTTEIEPNSMTAWFTKGVVLDDLGQHQEAIKCYDKGSQTTFNKSNL